MKYKSKIRIDNKYIEYLDDQHRSHTLLNKDIEKNIKLLNLKIDKWYECYVVEDNNGIKEIKDVK